MSIVHRVFDLTSRLHELLGAKPDSDKRDDVIKEVEDLLEERQHLLGELRAPFSEEEKKVGQQIVAYNKEIDEILVQLKLEVQIDMNKVKKQKSSNEKYVNPYKNVNFDGMFFDKKK